MIAAFIPARGGSKGIPRKNLADLDGMPLVAWSIEAAKTADVDRVFVSTEDNDIAEAAKSYGAEIHERPDALATDAAQIEPAIAHWMEQHPEVSTVVLLQPTSPLRPPGIIGEALGVLEECDSVFSGRVVEGYTWRLMQRQLIPNYLRRENRQFRQWETIEENGSVYAFRSEGFNHTGNRLHGNIGFVPMTPLDSLQIDTPADLETVRTIVSNRKLLHVATG